MMPKVTPEILSQMQAASRERYKNHVPSIESPEAVTLLLEQRESLIEENERLILRKKFVCDLLSEINLKLDGIGITNYTNYTREKTFHPDGVIIKSIKDNAIANLIVDVEPETTIDNVLFFDGTDIPSVKCLFTSKGKLRRIDKVKPPPRIKLKNRPIVAPPKEIIRMPIRAKEEVVSEKPFVRPPAVYTNIPTPFGIATEMLMEQLKKSG